MIAVLLLALVQSTDAETAKVVERVNVHRRAAGLDPVALDPALSKGCAAHAEYLVRNEDRPSTQGLGLHSEDVNLGGYTREGERAAKASVIYLGLEGSDAVEGWMASLFHRIPLMQSRLRRIGYGSARGGRAKVTVVLDATNGLGPGKDAPSVVYPAEGQKDVPREFSPEIPDPIPESPEKKAGYPVTVIFGEGALVKDAVMTLRDASGKEVACWLSSPAAPAAADYQRNTVALIPKEPLPPGTALTVSLAARVTGRPLQKTWTFTTVGH